MNNHAASTPGSTSGEAASADTDSGRQGGVLKRIVSFYFGRQRLVDKAALLNIIGSLPATQTDAAKGYLTNRWLVMVL